MLEISQLTRCQQRKEEVLRQCAAHRDTLMAEARVLRPMAIWVDVGIAAVRNARACWETWIPFFSSWQAGKGDSGSHCPFVERALEEVVLRIVCVSGHLWRALSERKSRAIERPKTHA
jgi:hypothetical protein